MNLETNSGQPRKMRWRHMGHCIFGNTVPFMAIEKHEQQKTTQVRSRELAIFDVCLLAPITSVSSFDIVQLLTDEKDERCTWGKVF
jgi:hypothetical protein